MTQPSILRALRRVAILMLFALGGLHALPMQAHMRGLYDTKAAAEKRAVELKCKGAFAMGSMWMPCANERALHDALQKVR